MEEREYMTHINPISIADVILLLIIFFLLTSTYVMEPGIRVKLPVAKTAEVVSEKNIIISLTIDGKVFINNKEVSLEEFDIILGDLLKSSKNKVVIIRSDKRLPVSRLVRIMDLARSAGAEKFLIATRRFE